MPNPDPTDMKRIEFVLFSAMPVACQAVPVSAPTALGKETWSRLLCSCAPTPHQPAKISKSGHTMTAALKTTMLVVSSRRLCFRCCRGKPERLQA